MTDTRKITYSTYADKVWQRGLIHLAEWFTGRKKLQALYDSLQDQDLENTTFWAEALKRLNVNLDTQIAQLEKVPANQPLVVVANHPFGVVDGLVICHLVSLIRPNFKIVLNDVLCQDSRIEKHVLPIDFAPTRAAQKENLRTRNACIEELNAGGTVIIFPAGGVSTSPSIGSTATDLDWKPFTQKLIDKSKASVLPMYFHGQNSFLFQLFSQFSLTLRIGMLVREVINKRNSTLKIEIGELIPFEDIEAIGTPEARLEHLRQSVYNLRQP